MASNVDAASAELDTIEWLERVDNSSLAGIANPTRGLDRAPTPGILYLAMEGAFLKENCGGGQTANSALNCSSLVSGEVNFPAYGNEQSRAITYQKLRAYYDDFNLLLTTAPPPNWVPYTMAIIGGTPNLAGLPPGECGVAPINCDGSKRNDVSLIFPEDICDVTAAAMAAQESAHTWGLEHTNSNSDVMFGNISGENNLFLDLCVNLDLFNSSNHCPTVHELYCSNDVNQQNSHAEMLGVFGPRVEDTTPPTITNLVPGNGSTWTTADNILITATFAEDSNFLAVKWDWIEGRPEALADGYSRCTNQVCEDEFLPWRDNQDPYDFIAFDHPPAGTYTMKVEAMDAYGNYVTETITFTVIVSDEPSTTGLPGETETTGEDTDSDTDSDTVAGTESPTTGADSIGDETTGGDTVDPTASETDTTTGSEAEEGCNCRTSGTPGGAMVLLLAALAVPRRRRP